ncbi:hypothetical protein J6590_062691 [Homalodisca vitripennis]|nr:hypothetical protein J6590_062691 [Homalodisca vitripennis]
MWGGIIWSHYSHAIQTPTRLPRSIWIQLEDSDMLSKREDIDSTLSQSTTIKQIPAPGWNEGHFDLYTPLFLWPLGAEST